MKKGIFITLLLLFMFSTTSYVGSAFAGTLDNVKTSSGDTLVTQIDTATTNLISTVRKAAVLVAIVFVCWIGYSLWFSSNPQSISQMKVRCLFFVAGLFVAIDTEQIVGAVLNFMGYKIL